MTSAVREALDRLVAFDTTTTTASTADVVAWIAQRVERPGVAVWDLVDPLQPVGIEQHNLLVRLGPEAPGAIVLSAHLDCVPVTGQPWTTDPFTVREDGDRLVGRGVTDMKGFVAACLAGLDEVDPATLARPIVLAFSHSEEIGTRGAPHLADALVEHVEAPALAIVGEPTQLQVVRGHKGVGGLRITVRGVDGHSSQPRGTAHAVHAAGRIIARVADLVRQHEDEGPADDRFDPPFSTFAVNQVTGGQAINIVPREASLVVEGRNVPGVDLVEVFDGLRDWVEDVVVPELRRHVDDPALAGVDLDWFAPPVPPLLTPALSPAEQLATGCGATVGDATHVAYATDAGHFAERGIPTIVCGPGSIEQAHKPDEWLDAAQLDAALDFVRRVGAEAARR